MSAYAHDEHPIQLSGFARNSASSRSLRRHAITSAAAVLMMVGCLFVGQSALAASAGPVAAASAAPADSKAGQVLLPVSLETGLDSKKRNAGDEVEGKIPTPVHLSDGTVIPAGAKVVGHVIASKAKAKGDSESSLAIVFEKVALSGGKTLNIKGYIRAVGPNPNSENGSGGIGYSGLNQATQHSQTGMTPESVPLLSETSEGVVGIKDLRIDGDGVLHSDGKAVKVGHESQIMLRAEVLNAQ
jgi:hypothetical protein